MTERPQDSVTNSQGMLHFLRAIAIMPKQFRYKHTPIVLTHPS